MSSGNQQIELIGQNKNSNANGGWRLAICQALVVVYCPFVVATFVTCFTADITSMTKVFWIVVWMVGLPFSALAAFGTAWLARKGGIVRNLSLLSIAVLSSLLAFEMWVATPTAHHIKDMDHVPEGANFNSQLDNIKVDHVYFYSARTLRCNYYLRCHIVHKPDFDRFRDSIRREAAYRDTAPGSGEWNEKDVIEELGAGSGDFEAIRSWWDWPDRSDCEIFCLRHNDLVVFDLARDVVYLVKNGD